MFILDVSHHQRPDGFDWQKLGQNPDFDGLIARATYGTRPDSRCELFASHTRALGKPFGVYHFYRQTQPVETQLKAFRLAIRDIGGLRPGDFVPVLDIEANERFDGKVNRKIFNRAADEFGDAIKDEYGCCILYMSSFFPEHLGATRAQATTGEGEWAWILEPGYRYWLADYGKDAGSPRTPYVDKDRVVMHQWTGSGNMPEYTGLVEHIDMNAPMHGLSLAKVMQPVATETVDDGEPLSKDHADKLREAVSLLGEVIGAIDG